MDGGAQGEGTTGGGARRREGERGRRGDLAVEGKGAMFDEKHWKNDSRANNMILEWKDDSRAQEIRILRMW